MNDFINLALDLSEDAVKKQEFPVGAVLIHNNKVIAQTFNQTRTECDPSAHAEILALRKGAKILGNYRLSECDLYVSLEPCVMCAGAISHARIRRLYYAVEDPKGGAVSSNIHFFEQECCFHAPEIYYPFNEQRAKNIIHKFVKTLR